MLHSDLILIYNNPNGVLDALIDYINDGGLHLIEASKQGNTDIIQQLLQKNIFDVNYQDDHGKTALYWACSKGSDKIVEILLNEYNADPNIYRKKSKKSPLMMAAQKGTFVSSCYLRQQDWKPFQSPRRRVKMTCS